MRYLTLLIFLVPGFSSAQLQMEAVSSGMEVLQVLTGGNVKVEKVTYFGSLNAIGKFRNTAPMLDMKEGIFLGTGDRNGAKGPNNAGNRSTAQSNDGIRVNGDKDLQLISSGRIYDIVVLEFSFIPSCDTLSFNYVFASEEYPEYVGKQFNDVFGFFISGPGIKGVRNMALLPDDSTVISINSVNSIRNSEYFISNTNTDQNGLQFDGFTRKMMASSIVIPGKVYTVKIAIADVNDGIYDSGVFLEAGTFKCMSSDLPQLPPAKKDSVVASYILHIEFPTNSSVIPQEFHQEIDRICEMLLKNPLYSVDVNGHTDNSGTADYNLLLSEKRARSVASYMEGKGITGSRIHAKGYGQQKPLNRNRNEKEKKQNRRVEFIIKQ